MGQGKIQTERMADRARQKKWERERERKGARDRGIKDRGTERKKQTER